MDQGSEVCVIGAGPSGLCAVKHCLEYGLTVTCYEDRPGIGGIWTGSDPKYPGADIDGKAYTVVHDLVTLNTSQFVTSYSDFPLPDDMIPCLKNGSHYLSGSQFLEYMNRYAKAFGVTEKVEFSTKVVRIVKDKTSKYGDNSWMVTVRQKVGKTFIEKTTVHRYVIIATGLYRKPKLPRIEGQHDTPVKCVHSGHVRNTHDIFKDKQVVVIGGSISAGDIAQAAVQAGASKVTWATTRNPKSKSVLVVKRYPFNKEFAWDEWVSHFGHKYFPTFMKKLQLESMLVWIHRREPGAGVDINNDRFVIQDTALLDVATRGGQFVTQSSTVGKFHKDEKRVTLANGEEVDADVCVFGTGYDVSYPFLDQDSLGEKGVADLCLHRSTIALNPEAWGLVFLYTTPLEGSGIVTSEMEARWIAHQIAHGKLSTEENRIEFLKKSDKNDMTFKTEKRRFTIDELTSLAADLSCSTPNLIWQAFLTPFPWKRRVGLATAFGPWLPHHYRLQGPNACPEKAGKAIVRASKVLMGWKFEFLVIAVDLIHLLLWSFTFMRLTKWQF